MWKCEILVHKIRVTDVIDLENSDSDDGEVNEADLANIAGVLSDDGENGQCVKAASQAILEVEHGGHGKAPGTEDGRR
jgi:hypothetical protein